MIYDEYAQYTAKYKAEFGPRTLVLIEIGSFWEIYDAGNGTGANMKDIADVLNIQVSKKNKNIAAVDRTNPYMAGFPSLALDKFLPVLINKGYTVVMVGQVTPPPNPKRAVVKIASPGTFINDADSKSNWIATIYYDESGVGIGVGLVDLATGKTEAFEAYAADKELVIEKIMAFYSPCQVVTFGAGQGPLVANPTLDMGLAYDKQVHSVSFQNELLSKCFSNDSMLSSIEYCDLEQKPLATVAFTMMLCFCKKHNDRITHMLVKPGDGIASNMHFDLVGNSASQIDLGGIEKLLNGCATAIGRRYFKHRLFNPFCIKTSIEESWNTIELAMANKDTLSKTCRILDTHVYDVEKLFRKCVLKIGCTLDHLIMFYSSVKAMMDLGHKVHDELNTLFQDAIDDANEQFKQGFWPKLDAAAQAQKAAIQAEDTLVETWQKKVSPGWQLKLEKSSDAAFFAITSKRWKENQNDAFKEFRVLHNGTNNIKITCTAMEDIFRKRILADAMLSAATTEAIGAFCDMICEYKHHVDDLVDTIAQTDFVNTCAKNALHMGHVRPKFAGADASKSSSATLFDAQGLRHPLMETLINVPYVPNDIKLSGSDPCLIYGLNAAGKSSLLKAIGIAAIMSHAGMFVACKSLTLGCEPYNSLFCRISKNDDMYSGKSTFMVEMSELRAIMKSATRQSLVLADELCAGTETKSALAIVASACRVLGERGVAFAFTTHLHELTYDGLVPENLVNIWHLDVYFDQALDALVYNRKLKPGQGSQIYGLEVCKSLDMDPEFIKLAFDIRNKCAAHKLLPQPTRYNASVHVNTRCGACSCLISTAGGKEVHHIAPQHLANAEGLIGDGGLKKHSPGNLVTLCTKCHDLVHSGEINIIGHVSTSKGRKLKIDRQTKQSAHSTVSESDIALILELSKKMTVQKVFKELQERISKYKINRIIQNNG